MEQYFIEPPFSYSPGLAQYIVRGDFSYSGFFATMLRLEDKNVIILKSTHQRFFPKLLAQKRLSGLSESERAVYRFVCDFTKARTSFNHYELGKLLSRKFKDHYYDYQCAIMQEMWRHKFLSAEPPPVPRISKFAMEVVTFALFLAALLTDFALFVFGIILIFIINAILMFLVPSMPSLLFGLNILMMLGLFLGWFLGNFYLIYYFIMMAPSILNRKYNALILSLLTRKADAHREKWRHYASFIRNYSELEKQPAKYHELWGEHYTYALAVGAVEGWSVFRK